METSGEDRMCTLDDTLKRLHLEGHISSEDAYKMCTDKKRFEYVMKDYGQGKRR
jgi:Tfp pilus assembly pilus retraction ATPase PilT